MSIYGNPVMLGGSGGGGGGGSTNILSGKTRPTAEQGSNGNVYLQYGIPIEYTPVEYLEVTSAGPYIDTGVSCKNNPYYEVTFQYMQTPGNNYGVFGMFESGGIEVIINTYGGVSYASAMGGQGSNRAVFSSTVLQKHKILATSDGIYIDDVKSSATVNWSSLNYSRTYYLFAFNYNGTPNIYKTANTRIYSCRLWSGDTLIRHYIPVYRNSDNEPGMYDLVNGEFKSNAGTGSFGVGVPIEYGSLINLAYAKVSGAWQDLIGTDINDIDLGGGGGDNFLGGFYFHKISLIEKNIGYCEANVDDIWFTPIDDTGSIVKLDTSQPFEVGITAKITNYSHLSAFCGQYLSTAWGTGNRALSIVLSDATYCAFAFPGSSGWATIINPIPSGYSLPTDTDIFFRISWDGTTAYALINDGANVMTASEALSSVYYNSSNYMVFANQGQKKDGVSPFVTFDSSKLYMKQNGTLIWGRE